MEHEPETNGQILIAAGTKFFASGVLNEKGVRRLRDYLHGSKEEKLSYDVIANNYLLMFSFVVMLCRMLPALLFRIIRQVTQVPSQDVH